MNKFLYTIFFLFILPQIVLSTGKSTQVNGSSFSILVNNNSSEYRDEIKGSFTLRDYFPYTDETEPGTYKLPFKDLIVAIPPNSKPAVSLISSDVKELRNTIPKLNPKASLNKDLNFSYTDVELKDRIKKPKLNNIFEVKDYFWFREFYCVRIRLHTHLFNENSNSILEYDNVNLKLEFNDRTILTGEPIINRSLFDNYFSNIIYNYDIAEQFRSTPDLVTNDTTGNWINFNADYIKIGVVQDGLFRITKNDLEQAGVNTSFIDPRTFFLIESGIEIPVYVSGEGDGAFNDDDYVEFFGTKNYSKISSRVINPFGIEYNEYLNRYTDTTVYFLTWGGTPGKRIPLQNIFPTGLSDSITYYTHFTHYEANSMYQPISVDLTRNQDPDWLENNSWWREFIGVGTSSHTFQKVDQEIVPGLPARFYYKAASSASNIAAKSHNITLNVNNIVIDSQVVNRNDRILLQGTLNSNFLIGKDSSIVLRNYSNGTSPNQLVDDWYEVEYPRYLKLTNDSLLFEIKYDLSKELRVIKITNVTSANFEIYKVKSEVKKITNYNIFSSTLVFTDTIATGDAYVVINPQKIKSPLFIKKKQFVNLRNPVRKADYIAISNQLLQPAATNYVNFIGQSYSLDTELIWVEDIFDEFSFGYPYPEGIKKFLAASVQYWQVPKPSFVNMLGSANYDYKNYLKKDLNLNLVPSYGEPVSDPWFTMFDDTNTLLQQLLIGRIPAQNSAELESYLVKHQNYLNQQYDVWNKKVIFFSGGDPNASGQIQTLKNINDYIINNYAKNRPLSEFYDHFYKTISPQSNFGPYSPEYVDNSIKTGGLYISYIGHSGTTTWDNGVTDFNQLKNNFNKGSLITDFGCSTNKFAEPDILAFGNLFVLAGQAIAYVGNSSLGFLSTSTTIPKYFYESILKDSIYNLSAAHFDAKLKMFNYVGSTGVYRIFALTNVLIGDPLINMAVPDKINLALSVSDITLFTSDPNEHLDSLGVLIKYSNLGIAPADSFSISVINKYQTNTVYEKIIRRVIPEFLDSLLIYIPINGKPGQHLLSVLLDVNNEIDEIYEDDNSVVFSYNVTSSSLKPMAYSKKFSALSLLKVLNHSSFISLLNEKIITEVDTSEEFTSAELIETHLDTFISVVDLSGLENGRRYWLRCRLDYEPVKWGETISFIKADSESNFYLADNYSFANQSLFNLDYNESLNTIVDSINIRVESGGGDVSKQGDVFLNGTALLPNSFNWGMGITVLDQNTFNVDTAQTFWYGDNPAEAVKLVNLINSIPDGKIVVMCAQDDAGSNLSASLKNAIKTLGSTKVDNISYRGPWVLIGSKGASPGDVIEIVQNRSYPTILIADTTFIRARTNGILTTSIVGPSSVWKSINVSQHEPANSEIIYQVFGHQVSGEVDTLGYVTFNNNSADLGFIDANEYPYIQVNSEFKTGDNSASPELNILNIDFTRPAELGTNFQTVSINKDTVDMDEDIMINFFIYNVGEVGVDSFNIKVDLLKSNVLKKTLMDSLVVNISSNEKKEFIINYHSDNLDESGNFAFRISIDPENKIRELYKDNNVFEIPFYVKPDTNVTSVTNATMNATFDGNDIMDGDFISGTPEIVMILNYPSWFPAADTSAVEFFLDQQRIYFGSLNVEYDTANRNIIYSYRPALKDGEHTFRIYGMNVHGVMESSPGYQKMFMVSNQAQLIDAYNYPNPFKENTYFTFRLTQIPDELRVKIYTIAGRLIKEIIKPGNELSLNFNSIFWDGKDEDGDDIANGVYLCKFVLRRGNEVRDVTQKAARIR